jgi:anti-sigma-K factor RskA
MLEALAAEYVLGTLRGRARAHFERWRRESVLIEQRVRDWEDRLAGLALGMPPVAPSPQLFAQLEARLAVRRAPAPAPRWRALAAAVALVVILGGALFAWRLYQQTALEPLATITATTGAPVWRLEVSRGYDRLRATVVGAVNAPANRSLELWALPPGRAPVSLGLLPADGRLERPLSAAQRDALRAAPQVAVSSEPLGGSPTGAPTGPILFVAPRAPA